MYFLCYFKFQMEANLEVHFKKMVWNCWKYVVVQRQQCLCFFLIDTSEHFLKCIFLIASSFWEPLPFFTLTFPSVVPEITVQAEVTRINNDVASTNVWMGKIKSTLDKWSHSTCGACKVRINTLGCAIRMKLAKQKGKCLVTLVLCIEPCMWVELGRICFPSTRQIKGEMFFSRTTGYS